LALGAAGAISVLLLMPYLLAMMPQLKAKISIPIPLFALLQTLQGGVLITLFAWAGLALGWKHELDAPWLRMWLHAGSSQPRTARWGAAIAIGIAAGTACVVFDAGFAWLMSANKPSTTSPNWWQGLLASFYGGISEETLCRLFLVSLLVWIGARFSRDGVAGAGIYWIAIMTAAVLFGIAHLPAAFRHCTLCASSRSTRSWVSPVAGCSGAMASNTRCSRISMLISSCMSQPLCSDQTGDTR